ncbi:MAG: hypothetical protein HKUEN02_16640 [Anaerolineaceae bacterium]|nr:MAG: hypothetical protein HKUEN02_16640 [Anaerolineaceae bacterium]
MSLPTQPLRDEHAGLFPHVEEIRKTAEKVGSAPLSEITLGVDEAYDFLAHHLKIHAEAEEAALYPVVQQLLGSPDVTKTMSRDHVEIIAHIEELAALKKDLKSDPLPPAQAEALRRVLYGAYALVKVHFAKEEEIYLNILDEKMSAEAVLEMYTKMEAAAHAAMEAARAA